MTDSRKWALWIVALAVAGLVLAFLGINPLPLLVVLVGRVGLLIGVGALVGAAGRKRT